MTEVISIAGSILSLIGVLIALVQIRKTLRAARAAEIAAKETQQAIARNILLADVSTCTRTLEEIKVLVRGERHEAALMRVTDLSTLLIQLQHLNIQPASETKTNFARMITQLTILRELLEQKVYRQDTEINPVQVNTQLSKISDQLSRLLGEEKYAVGRRRDA